MKTVKTTVLLLTWVLCRRTSDLIPLCHPLPLDKVHVDIRLEGNTAIVECECRVTHKTGVEMEVRSVQASMLTLSHELTLQRFLFHNRHLLGRQ